MASSHRRWFSFENCRFPRLCLWKGRIKGWEELVMAIGGVKVTADVLAGTFTLEASRVPILLVGFPCEWESAV
ncbi:unnamed protein product [Nippostrongylus brasiliensis]|uniref:UDPG_MGDP_dh_N domain-containing protein n=1 Tax=Nippostrongylus brasiliensis TaxID=27835 RepID=A0A0N4Y3W2_NIPBR|nr:unnamed protein product [Nippostrongylus brasiliensis]